MQVGFYSRLGLYSSWWNITIFWRNSKLFVIFKVVKILIWFSVDTPTWVYYDSCLSKKCGKIQITVSKTKNVGGKNIWRTLYKSIEFLPTHLVLPQPSSHYNISLYNQGQKNSESLRCKELHLYHLWIWQTFKCLSIP